jgi:anti-sigma regulatory factor (Ser/Thr protein kinase)
MATVSSPWAYTLQLPHDPRAPGIARCTLRAVLRAHHMAEVTETAELLTSELVTNAHLYSAEPCEFRLGAREPHRLRLSVWDANPEIPAPFKGTLDPVDPEAENGRGLHLVQLCADRWGAHPLKHGGKLLWVECVQNPECQ